MHHSFIHSYFPPFLSAWNVSEYQVCYGEIDKPYASDIGLQTHASHPDDHRVPGDAEDNGNGVEDNGNIIHNGINVHCSFLMVG